ncbi:MAG: EVE domain-containing protein [Vampirovibrionales bacterium]
MDRSFWLLKTEPNEYSFEQLLRDGMTNWDGVRNYQARANLKAMKKDDWALIYHSVGPKTVVGVAVVSQEAFPDSTYIAPSGKDNPWVAVEVKPLCAFKAPVSLNEIKGHSVLSTLPLVTQSRLSVMPIPHQAFFLLCQMGGADCLP